MQLIPPAIPMDTLHSPTSVLVDTVPASQRQLLDMIHCVNQPLVLASDAGKVMGVNAAAAELLGDNAETFVGEHWPSWLASPFQGDYLSSLTSLVSQAHSGREVQLQRADGLLLSVNLSLSYLPGPVPHYLIGLEDLSRHKAEIQRLQMLASTDCLTGLANRRYLNETLQQKWHGCVAHQTPISVLIVDIDYFKQFNDQHGHIKGDECLKAIAGVLTAVLPSTQCLAARLGGEEFVLVLPGFNAAMAHLVAKEVSEGIEALHQQLLCLPANEKVTVSQGIACEFNGQFRTPEAMLQAADTALYRAKRDGRNRIVVSE